MNILQSNYFYYKDDQLFCEEINVNSLIEKHGTPLYIYSKAHFQDQYKRLSHAFKDVDHKLYYACKSNFNINVIKTFLDLGSGVDVNSAGELYRAKLAGAKEDNIILTGVGKTRNEIIQGIKDNVLMIKAESEEEIYEINSIGAEMNVVVPVAIRVNPDVDAKTHPYISTGLAENKFGVNTETALRLYALQPELKNIKFTGIDMHIGSQITTINPFVEAIKKLSDVFFKVKAMGVDLHHFDCGGGLGVKYHEEDVFTVEDFAAQTVPILKELNCKILFEPGRFLTANGGILVAKILYTKTNGTKNFYIVDTAVNDLMRPGLYGAYHHIQPVNLKDKKELITADVVGPICETGDFLAKNRNLVKCKKGDYLAVYSAGSYGMVMSSNYNARPRAAEVMVSDSHSYLIRERESYEHLIYTEKVIDIV